MTLTPETDESTHNNGTAAALGPIPPAIQSVSELRPKELEEVAYIWFRWAQGLNERSAYLHGLCVDPLEGAVLEPLPVYDFERWRALPLKRERCDIVAELIVRGRDRIRTHKLIELLLATSHAAITVAPFKRLSTIELRKERRHAELLAYKLPDEILAGGRNQELARYVLSLRANRQAALPAIPAQLPKDVLRVLVDANQSRCKPPLPLEELEQIVKRACKLPLGQEATQPAS